MASHSARKPTWRQPGSPIGRKGPRKAHPKYKRHMNEAWSSEDLLTLKQLARVNTATGVISLKMGRTPTAIRSKAHREHISLMPANRSPYSRRVG